MNTITLEAVVARQTELAAMIEQLRTTAAPTTIQIAEQEIALQPGEHYAGLVLNDDGTPSHHLVLLAARPKKRLDWDAATGWALTVGGALPTRREQSLLFAHCKAHLEAAWHWSCEAHEDDASSAWLCSFDDGGQLSDHKSYEGCAVAVRRCALSTSVL